MDTQLNWTEGHYQVWAAWQQAGPNPRTRTTSTIWARVTTLYDQLRALPRRVRRALQRQWKQSLAGVALVLTLGSGFALAATIPVTTTTPDINADGQCSLIEAIVNANDNALTHADCVAGNGADTITLPVKQHADTDGGSQQHLWPDGAAGGQQHDDDYGQWQYDYTG